GGSWFNKADFLRISSRYGNPPETTSSTYGFRCVQDETSPVNTQTIIPTDMVSDQSACPGAPAQRISIGLDVTVMIQNWDKLKLRSKPLISDETFLKDLTQGTRLHILGGPQCVESNVGSFWFWEVEVVGTGERGWVAEGDFVENYIE
ncbi:MAG: hypothetical protein ACOYYJ_02885, partial [Chloroflexota bacterium]